jgi:hypothetical protein
VDSVEKDSSKFGYYPMWKSGAIISRATGKAERRLYAHIFMGSVIRSGSYICFLPSDIDSQLLRNKV